MSENIVPSSAHNGQPTPQKNTIIYIGLAVVFIIAAALNYDALRNFAYDLAEVNYWLSFGVPVLIDTFIALAVYITLKNKVIGEGTTLAWSIVVVFSLASIYLNSLHYPANIYGWSMAVLVPVVVFGTAELAKQQMEIEYKRDGAVMSITRLVKAQSFAQKELDTLHGQRDELARQLDTDRTGYTAQISQLKQEWATLRAEVEQLQQQRKQAHANIQCAADLPSNVLQAVQLDTLIAAGWTKIDAARLVGVSRNTVPGRLGLVNGQSLIGRDGGL